jgi:hypothetical protein
LGQIADLDAGHRPRLADDVGVDTGHDAQQGGFPGAVESQYSDLGAGEKRERNILEDFALGRDDLAHPVHGIDVLGHCVGRITGWNGSAL